MNSNAHRNSAGRWVHQLFERPSILPSPAHGKTYYAKRYQPDANTQEQTPFNALFSSESKCQLPQEFDKLDISTLFGQDSFVQEFNAKQVEPPQSCKTTHKFATNIFLTVLNCYKETLDTKTFRLGRTDGQPFDYLPGQYITISVTIDGKPYKRSYSIASPPSRPGILEITVKSDPRGGVVSNWLNNQLTVGDTLHVKGPYGTFTCAPKIPSKILFLAAGSGIVPIMSMLRWLADIEAKAEVTVLLSFRTLNNIIYRNELDLMAARHSNIKLFVTLTNELCGLTQSSGLTGRVTRNLIADVVPDLPERAVYLCGPEAFMTDCRSYLQGLKLPDDQLYCESFAVNSLDSETHDSKDSTKQFQTVQRSRNKTGNYQIKFEKSAITIATDGSRTLLEVAETAGIKLDHECRAGSCGECMVKCLEGGIIMTGQAEIDENDKKKGWIYACCAYPASDAVLDI